METTETVNETNVHDNGIFYRLFEEAESVRWRMTEYPWASVDAKSVSPSWIAVGREMLCGELTTFSATQRFFTDFGGDVDFTQWLTVWLYEETKHPSAILKWLDRLGQKFDSAYMLQGRQSLPFMPERMGTMAANIISEMVAATLYVTLARQPTIEPVFRSICRNIGGDEARHGASFYSFAKKRLARSTDPKKETLEALRVLLFWVTPDFNSRLGHPVNLTALGLRASPAVHEAVPADAIQAALESTYRRALHVFGTLFAIELRDRKDLEAQVAALSRQTKPVAGPLCQRE